MASIAICAEPVFGAGGGQDRVMDVTVALTADGVAAGLEVAGPARQATT
jgi:hypothetical protein